MLNNTGDQKTAPVTVTRGLNTGFFSQKVDWLEGTFRAGTPINLPSILSQDFVETKAFNGYTTASLYADKRVHMANGDRPEMGNHIIWNGEACGLCPIDLVSLIKHLRAYGFSFTRIDFAVDIINCNLDPSRATEEITNGRIKTRALQFPFWADAKGKGYTQYIGKKASEVYARIYDKAAEMGIEQDHTRIELVVRHSRADKAAEAVSYGADFRGMVVSFVNFEKWSEWSKAMDVPEIKLPKEQELGNTEKWLLDACAPALARTIFLNPGSGFFDKFTDEVTRRIEELSKNRQTVH
jgi:hypothetical protein